MGESINFFGNIKSEFGLEDKDLNTYSPQTLAFIGDSIYDLIIRSVLIGQGNRGVNGLHRDKSNLVKAQKQAEMMTILKPYLTEEEEDVYRRGKNTKTMSSAKNASLGDYHKATGFESLLGYLYLQGKEERIYELLQLCHLF